MTCDDRSSPSKYDFVDAHHHLQNIADNPYPWLTEANVKRPLAGDISGIQKNYLPANLRRDLGAVNLIKSVHIQHGWDPRDPVGETLWLEQQADETGLPSAIVAFADLADPTVGEVLEGHAAYPRVRGIRQILKWHPNPELSFASRPDLTDDQQWRRGYGLLKRFGMSFDAQLFPAQHVGLARLAADFPDTLIIVNHAGMPVDRSSEGTAVWSDGLKRLASLPNVFIKLSGFGLYSGRNWSVDEVGPLLLRIIDIFGAERCMFASNLPVDALYHAPEAITDMFAWIAARVTLSEAKMLLVANAERAYRI
jgi:predicted TIM-barrel fold metal-dependent hydrolase